MLSSSNQEPKTLPQMVNVKSRWLQSTLLNIQSFTHSQANDGKLLHCNHCKAAMHHYQLLTPLLSLPPQWRSYERFIDVQYRESYESRVHCKDHQVSDWLYIIAGYLSNFEVNVNGKNHTKGMWSVVVVPICGSQQSFLNLQNIWHSCISCWNSSALSIH